MMASPSSYVWFEGSECLGEAICESSNGISQAFFCPHCGEIWARVSAVGGDSRWVASHYPCRQCVVDRKAPLRDEYEKLNGVLYHPKYRQVQASVFYHPEVLRRDIQFVAALIDLELL